MQTREKTFTLRFTLTAEIPDELFDDDTFEEDDWLREWEQLIKPRLIRTVFSHLRSFPDWDAHIRNRGVPAEDEIEIVVRRHFDGGEKPTVQ